MSAEAHKPGPDSPGPARLHEQMKPDVSSWRLLATLGIAGVVAGLLIVVVYLATLPRIQAYKAKMLRLAVEEVLMDPDRYDTLYVDNGALTPDVPVGVDPRRAEKIYVGYREDHGRVGYAIVASGPGFQDAVKLIFGYDPTTGRLLGMKVLESKETPGLGDKIEKDPRFVSQFDGAVPPLVGMKRGAGNASDPGRIEMITGATISSRAVIRMISRAVKRLDPVLEAHEEATRQ